MDVVGWDMSLAMIYWKIVGILTLVCFWSGREKEREKVWFQKCRVFEIEKEWEYRVNSLRCGTNGW